METSTQHTHEFPQGSSVIYGLLGRCTVEEIVNRDVGGQNIRFYKLQVQKPPLSRSKKKDPAIWLPVAAASQKGLRAPMTQTDLDEIFKVFTSKEYYFNANRSWIDVVSELETAINTQGALGLAKVASYIFVLKNRQLVTPPEVNRFADLVTRNLIREIAELSGEPLNQTEAKIEKMMKPKLAPNH